MGFHRSLFLAILERQVKIDVSSSLNVTDCGEKSFAVSSIKRASERSVVQSLGKRRCQPSCESVKLNEPRDNGESGLPAKEGEACHPPRH